jgi:hypothetical protein
MTCHGGVRRSPNGFGAVTRAGCHGFQGSLRRRTEVRRMSRKGRLRNATAMEIDRRIRNAADHLGGLVQHEKAVAEAAERDEVESELEERRKFERDLSAFVAAARTARNYLIQTAGLFGREEWLTGRLDPELFAFHGAVANQDLHDHPVTVVKTYDVKGTAVADVVRLVDGAVPVLIPRVSPPLRYTGMRLTYVEADLEPAARAAYNAIKDGPRGLRGVIELAGEYIEGLRDIVTDADRQRLFDSALPIR